MKTKYNNCSLTFAAFALASIALAAGCCTKRSSATAYNTSTPQGYSGGGAQEAQYSTAPAQPATAENMEGQTNMIVPLYKESVAVGKREVDAGSVRLKKIVKTETVNQPVELRHEEIIIERQPGTGQQVSEPSGQAFQEKETVINLTREEPVVEKRTTSAGQIVVQRRSSSEQTNIQAEVRTEDVDIAKSGNAQGVSISGQAAGAAESAGGQSAGAASSSITDPAMLSSATDPASLAGRSVQLSNLKVQNVVGDRVAVLSTDSGQTVCAVCGSDIGNIKAGDTVSVNGTVKTTASSGLSGEAAQALGSQSIYIDAKSITAAAH